MVWRPILLKPKPALPKPATLEDSADSEDDDFNPDAPEVEDNRDGDGDESSSDESDFSSASEDLGAVANNDLLLELPSDDSEDDDFNPDKVDSDDDSGSITAKRHVERLDYKKLYDDAIMAWLLFTNLRGERRFASIVAKSFKTGGSVDNKPRASLFIRCHIVVHMAILMGAMDSRVENQNEIDACIAGTLPDLILQ
nr:homeobox protein HAT3.1-like isoform X2 [Tanacetum cinerariifolium]